MRAITPRGLLVALLAIAWAACDDGGTGEVDARAPADPKGDHASAGLSFRELDARHPLPAADRATVIAALARLQELAARGSSGRQRALAGETLARIVAGDVIIASLDRARGTDLWHMCLDLGPGAGCPATPPRDPAWAGSAALRKALAEDMDGYTWGNRMYFRFDDALAPEALAQTLVHEVSHVLNRSECMYYADYFAHEIEPTLAWLEEYRAFLAECVLARGKNATSARCDGWAAAQIIERGYDMTPDLGFWVEDPEAGSREIATSLFADDGRFGWLTPRAAHWPAAFAECEALAR